MTSLLLVGLMAVSAHTTEPRLLRVAATEDRLLFEIGPEPGARRVELRELRPYQSSPADATLPTVWEGRVPEQGSVAVPRFVERRDRLYSKFQLVDTASGKALGPAKYVSDLSRLEVATFPYPWPESVKGITCPVDRQDILDLGVKYINTNVMLGQMIDWSGGDPEETWEVDGEQVPINLGYFRRLDEEIRFYTDAGINVTVVVLNGVPTHPDPNNPFIHPNTDLAGAPFHLGAINVTDERGIRYYRAAMEYMARRYSRPDARYGWISGYIIGNEVTAHWEWYNIGHMPLDGFVEHYGIAMRIADLAVRRYHRDTRVYLSLEHHWNTAIREDNATAFRGKDFLELFNHWSKQGGDFPWHLAFHPYPENLFEPDFWQDRMAVLSTDSPKITFQNIEVLPAFLHRPQFDCEGRKRHIIFSEQGFHAPDSPEGEQLQAAAYAYAYFKTSRLEGVDAFMLHRHVSYRGEGGLRLGLWTWAEDGVHPGRKMPIYEVFRLADTDQWEQAFEFAKPIIGIEDWNEALPAEEVEVLPDLTPTFDLVRDGVAKACIVLEPEAPAAAAYAAHMLKDGVMRISGAALPIETAATTAATRIEFRLDPGVHGLGPDGVRIQTRADGRVLLSAVDERGLVYGATVLLERYLGVRFLARDCTVYPARDTVTLPEIDYSHTPPLAYRETLYWDSFPREIAVQQRLNGPYTKCDAEVGGKWEFHPYVHSFCKLIPPEEFGESHPEYFSLVNGKRTPQAIHGQLCLSNPEVLRIATERVLQWIEEHPEVPVFDVSQNDGNGWCECPECQAIVDEEGGAQSGPILRFVNAIAERVAVEYPDKSISTLAYAYSVTPPAHARPAGNVIIRLCHAGCYFHGFEDCGLGARLKENIQAWSQYTDRIFVWHYGTNFAHYIAPNPNLEAMVRDIRAYVRDGVNGLMVQGNYQGPGGELAELRQYLAAQIMWDPTRNTDMLRLEFCRGAYGRAAGQVVDFLRLMDALAQRPEVHAFGAWDPVPTIPPEFVSTGLRLLARARAGAGSREAADRVAKLMLPLWYLQITSPEHFGTTPEQVGDILMEFRSVAATCGATFINEGKTMPVWLAEMEARYGAASRKLVADLYLRASEAQCRNCLDWRPSSILRKGGEPQADNVLQDTYAALAPGQGTDEDGDEDGDDRRNEVLLSLFHHPKEEGDADADFRLELPVQEAGEALVLQFGTGFTGPTDDGVRFSVLVDGETVWSTEQKTMPVEEHRIGLDRWAGRAVTLTLRVNGLENIGHDWANWVRPRVVIE